jgi:hypothetical protein
MVKIGILGYFCFNIHKEGDVNNEMDISILVFIPYTLNSLI